MLFSWSHTKKKAFTLLELIVVIVVLGVLAAIAIPTFQAVIQKSSDEATLTSLRAMAREAQALEAFDQNGWDNTDVEAAASDTTAVAPGVHAAGLVAKRDAGKDPIPGEVTYWIDGEGLALSQLSDSGRVCTVGANHSSVTPGSCSTSTATSSSSTLGVQLSTSAAAVYPPGTSISGSTGGTVPVAPAAPTNVTASAGDTSAQITFTPGDPGTAAVTYTVTATPGGQGATGSTSPITVTGLQNGTSYTFTVTATSAAGTATSGASNSVTPNPDAKYTQAVLADAPVAYWRLSGGNAESAASDLTGNAHNLGFGGSPTFGAAGPIPGTTAARFPANNAWAENVTLPTISGSYTVEYWQNVHTESTQLAAALSTRTPGEASFDIKVANGNQLYSDLGNGSSWQKTGINAPLPGSATGTWYHTVMTVTPSGYTFYINGQTIGGGTLSAATLLTDSNHRLNIARTAPNMLENDRGSDMAHVAVYSKALTAEQVAAHYRAAQN